MKILTENLPMGVRVNEGRLEFGLESSDDVLNFFTKTVAEMKAVTLHSNGSATIENPTALRRTAVRRTSTRRKARRTYTRKPQTVTSAEQATSELDPKPKKRRSYTRKATPIAELATA